jgi:1-acyl-sn-glycerol-3-phosphate acyltransferase
VSVIRATVCVIFWACYVVFAGILGIPTTLITGDISFLWSLAMWGARNGVRLGGVKMVVVGRDQLDTKSAYIYMSNHVSNIDPPAQVPELPQRIAVMTKAELFRIPILGRAMRLAQFVPVDRKNRDAAIDSVREAVKTVQSGTSMLVYPEGTRSRDGRLLPFKKGPFHLAIESGVPVVPITLIGTQKAWPKGKFAIYPVTVTMIFHTPIDPKKFESRESLMVAVKDVIASALPEDQR